jgi:hypothetical protein
MDTDKMLHIAGSSVIALAAIMFGIPEMAFIFTVILGLFKELWDLYIKETEFCVVDFMHSVVIGFFVSAYAWVNP